MLFIPRISQLIVAISNCFTGTRYCFNYATATTTQQRGICSGGGGVRNKTRTIWAEWTAAVFGCHTAPVESKWKLNGCTTSAIRFTHHLQASPCYRTVPLNFYLARYLPIITTQCRPPLPRLMTMTVTMVWRLVSWWSKKRRIKLIDRPAQYINYPRCKLWLAKLACDYKRNPQFAKEKRSISLSTAAAIQRKTATSQVGQAEIMHKEAHGYNSTWRER